MIVCIVYFYGEMVECWGMFFKLDVCSVVEVVWVLGVQLLGFWQYIFQNDYYVVCGKSFDDGLYLGDEEVYFGFGKVDFYIMFVIFGLGGGGCGGVIVKIFGGLFLVGVVFFLVFVVVVGGFGVIVVGFLIYGNFVIIGLGFVVVGLLQFMIFQNKFQQVEDENIDSFVFNGVVNMLEEGGFVFIVFGKFGVGFVVIFFGILVDDILV